MTLDGCTVVNVSFIFRQSFVSLCHGMAYSDSDGSLMKRHSRVVGVVSISLIP